MRVIGIGLDLVDLARVERMVARHGDRALRRLLTEAERAYVATRARPAAHIAARVAAKEAAYKAFQGLPEARAVGWQDLEVRRHSDGRPTLRLHGFAAELASRYGPLDIQLTITHSDATAGAVAIILKSER